MKTHLLVHRVAMIGPLLPRLCQLVRVGAPDDAFDALMAETGKLEVVSPHIESSLHLLPTVLALSVPDGL